MGFTISFSADIASVQSWVLGPLHLWKISVVGNGREVQPLSNCPPLLLSSLLVPRVWPEVLQSIATSEAHLRSDTATSEVPKLIMALAYGGVFCAPLFVKGGYSFRV